MVLLRWKGITGNLVLTNELKCNLATIKGKKADVSSVRPSSEQLDELWVECGFVYMQKVELRH